MLVRAQRLLETNAQLAYSAGTAAMARLTKDTHLGGFRIEALLGVGGMGEVYRARDTKLNRDVAIKVLPDAFTTDRDRLVRFRREAEVLASLNHPNIGQIYGTEDSGVSPALVLELVEGPTLAERLARGSLPLSEALAIAKQVADAIEAAHEAGVVHRDLKPANIKVRNDGTVKVLDFGLAKALSLDLLSPSDAANSPTIMTNATEPGVIMGTAAYMAPEQVKGASADRRADIWAFGVLLYEMLSGKHPFSGDSAAATLAAVLTQDVDWTALPASTPDSVRRLLARCIERDTRQRLRDIGEARIMLADSSRTETIARNPGPRPPFWRRATPIVLATLVGAALAGIAALRLGPKPPHQEPIRLQFTLPDGQAFTGTGYHPVVLSPDGSNLLYVANNRIYLRSLSKGDLKTIQGTEDSQEEFDPVFSPDGGWIAFYSPGEQMIKKVPTTGGVPAPLTPLDRGTLTGMNWGPSGLLIGQMGKGVMRVSPNGGVPELVVAVEGGELPGNPQLLPDGEHVLFSLATGTASDRWDKAEVFVQSITSKARKPLIARGSDVRYVPTGHIAYAVSGSVYATAFDVKALELTGDPVRILAGVRRAGGNVAGAHVEGGSVHFSYSQNGTLAYIPGPVAAAGSTLLQIGLFDQKGIIEKLRLEPGAYSRPRASPDGKSIAFEMADGNGTNIYIYNRSGTSAMQRLTLRGNNKFPTWTADSKRIAFQSDRDGDSGIFWQSSDGSGDAVRLTKPNPGESHIPESWSPKNVLLFSVTAKNETEFSLWTYTLQENKASPFGDVHSSSPPGAVFSPDGQLVAYATTERGLTTITVQSFPAGVKHQLTPKGSDSPKHPRWAPHSNVLFFNPNADETHAVAVTTQPAFAFGNPLVMTKMFLGGPPGTHTPYDVTNDGKFLGLILAEQMEYSRGSRTQIQFVFHWFEELRALVSAR